MYEIKLLDLPHILWINLNKNKKRRQYIEGEFKKYNLSNTRIEALYGIDYDKFCITSKPMNTNEAKLEFGCSCSHLKALEHFIETPSIGDYCLIAEDDLSFEYITYWKKSFWEYIKEAPVNFNIIQLSLTFPLNMYKELASTNMVKRKKYMLSAVVYLITRTAAIELLSFVPKINNRYDLRGLSNIKSDFFLFETIDHVFSIPLFTYKTHFNSNIHQKHVKFFHIPCKNMITSIWKR